MNASNWIAFCIASIGVVVWSLQIGGALCTLQLHSRQCAKTSAEQQQQINSFHCINGGSIVVLRHQRRLIPLLSIRAVWAIVRIGTYSAQKLHNSASQSVVSINIWLILHHKRQLHQSSGRIQEYKYKGNLFIYRIRSRFTSSQINWFDIKSATIKKCRRFHNHSNWAFGLSTLFIEVTIIIARYSYHQRGCQHGKPTVIARIDKIELRRESLLSMTSVLHFGRGF